MKMVNKRIYLAGQTCPTKSWYIRSSGIEISLTPSQQARIDVGVEIGEMARTLYPEGILVDEGSNAKNAKKTQQLINNESITVIFEATFIYGDLVTRTDILKRIDGEWHLIEVKSSAASDKIKPDLIDDLAYTTMVLQSCGITPVKSSLLLVSKAYRLGMDNNDFFVEIECTDKVDKRCLDFTLNIDAITKASGETQRPYPTMKLACKKCEFYKPECLGKNVDYPIFDLPRLNQKQFNVLFAENISLVSQIPAEYELSAEQKLVRSTVKNSEPFINKDKLEKLLGKIIYPAYYLDFESVSTAIPLYPDIGPYEELVTQYSIHKLDTLDGPSEHSEYLADFTKDDRHALAVKLLADIGTEGSVIVYHAQAEKRFIANLAKATPALSDELNKVIERIVDLEVILRESYYHSAFHGSYSIKVVLPVLVSELSYKNLEIGDGESAINAFADLARGSYATDEAKALCNALLRYCEQDTLAMVRIHQELINLLA